MTFLLYLIVAVGPSWAHPFNDDPVLIQPSLLTEGARFVWSYSDCSQGFNDCSEPYLYEAYTVTERKGSSVTIEISSSETLEAMTVAHHRFVADIRGCLQAGRNLGRFTRWKIHFYTRTFGQKWQLVSKRHKGDAFTEKFNCFSGRLRQKKRLAESGPVSGELFQWIGSPIRSWYSAAEGEAGGLAVLRTSRQYLMRLEEITL